MNKKRIIQLTLILVFLAMSGTMIWIHEGAVLSGVLTDYGIEPYEIDTECAIDDPTERHLTTFGK